MTNGKFFAGARALAKQAKRRKPAVKKVYSVTEARRDFSRLVDRAVAGEEIVLTKNGKPVARLIAFRPAK